MITLVNGTRRLELDDCAAGYTVESVDFGPPEVRAVAENDPLTDGVIDLTRYVGARSITINLALVRGPALKQGLFDALGVFLHPAVRTTMQVQTEPGGLIRSYQVRADDWSMPWERPTHNRVTLSFRTVGTPWAQGECRTVFLHMGDVGEDGRRYDEATSPTLGDGRDYDRTYPYIPPTSAHVTNRGNVSAHWTADIFGPVTGPVIRNVDLHEQVALTDLTIPSGQFVRVDSATRTVFANGDPGASRYYALDFAHTTWWLLHPGPNLVAVSSESATAPSTARITWCDSYM